MIRSMPSITAGGRASSHWDVEQEDMREFVEEETNGGLLVQTFQSSKKKEELCRINVSGQQYITTYSCLERYPTTLLGNKSDRQKHFYPELNAYFFNRNKACFESILTFYQTGKDQAPANVDASVYRQEKIFFRIFTKPDNSVTPERVKIGRSLTHFFGPNCQRKTTMIHEFLLDPMSSKLAKIWHTVDIVFICISITFMIAETDPTYGGYFERKEPSPISDLLFSINAIVIGFFTIDITLRLITWPGLILFWKNIFNILDLLSLLPFYVGVMANTAAGSEISETSHTTQSYVVLKVCRIFRIVRIFKFIKHSKDLIMIIKVVVNSRKELGLLVVLLGISTITFGSIMYYIENDTNGKMFNSILSGCWWAIVTITTLGYGDIHPITTLGKVVGSVLLTFGLVFLTLPMTIIVSKFSSIYETEKEEDISVTPVQ